MELDFKRYKTRWKSGAQEVLRDWQFDPITSPWHMTGLGWSLHLDVLDFWGWWHLLFKRWGV